MSFIASSTPAYFDEIAPSDKHQGTEICVETDRQTDSSTQQSSTNNSSHSANPKKDRYSYAH
jgi:hypothetical protein